MGLNKMEKKNKCELCGWVGKTHIHHIIPLHKDGEDNDNNKVEICPNHHSDSHYNEEEFAKEYNLVGEKMSELKLADLKRASFLFTKIPSWGLSEEEFEELKRIVLKYDFKKSHLMGCSLGISSDSAERYLKDKQDNEIFCCNPKENKKTNSLLL
jgi:hypothetical protein